MTSDAAIHSDADYFSDDIATFGDRVVGAREALGMTRSELARRMGIKDETLGKWEEDRAEPRANKLQLLAGILNVSMVWLMTGEGDGIHPGQVNETHTRDILVELRALQTENLRMAERIGRLEKRLRAVL